MVTLSRLNRDDLALFGRVVFRLFRGLVNSLYSVNHAMKSEIPIAAFVDSREVCFVVVPGASHVHPTLV